MSDPWNSPDIFWQLLRWLGRSDAPIILRPTSLHYYLSWGIQFLRNSTPSKFQRSTEANWRLAQHSLQCMQELRTTLDLQYHQKTLGTLKVFRDKSAFQHSALVANSLRDHGLSFEILNADQLLAAEPSLVPVKGALEGGILYPDDETGDAHLFCTEIKSVLEQSGVIFEFGQSVTDIATDVHTRRVFGVRIGDTTLRCKVVVIATGTWSDPLCRRWGQRLPIRPVKGYSVTLDGLDITRFPSRAIIDDAKHAAVTPLGPRLRLAGTAELGGWKPFIREDRIKMLNDLLGELFPEIKQEASSATASEWCGMRPTSSDGTPFIGESNLHKGLYFNTGHGHLGWTQCAGSSHALSELISTGHPSISLEAYNPNR